MPTFSLSLFALVTALAVHAAPFLKRDEREGASLHIRIDRDTCGSIGAKYGLSSRKFHDAKAFLECTCSPLSVLCSLARACVAAAERVCKETYLSVKDNTCQSVDDISAYTRNHQVGQ